MVILKNSEQLKLMRRAGRITGEALLCARDLIRPGVTTRDIDRAIREYIEGQGAKPSFLGYNGFPASACISINSEVIHGIPSKHRVLCEGDIVKVDVGAFIGGYHGDSAKTFPVGRVSETAERLIAATRQSFYDGVACARPGNRIGDVGSAIEESVARHGFSTVREFVGHGIGEKLHESPDVPNYGTAGRGCRLYAGMTVAIEPMVNVGSSKVKVLDDGWTVVTADGSLSAHYEHTVAILGDETILLTDVGE